MKPVLAVHFLFWTMLLCDHVVAQRYYSFEEACRNAGWTTGPCAQRPQQQQPAETVCIGKNAFHAEKSPGHCVKIEPPQTSDAEIFVEIIGLPNVSKINELGLSIRRSIGLRNASALFHKRSRMIIYDPDWARTVTAEFYLVLGHEAGHHFCGHTLGRVQSSPQEAELEADRFSGASIKQFEVYHGKRFLDDALKAAAQMYSVSGSRSHPPRAARLQAVLLGYNSGSPCGDLAPGMRGFSPRPR